MDNTLRSLGLGGVRDYVRYLDQQGNSLVEIAGILHDRTGVSIGRTTIWNWLREWRQEEVAA